MALLQSFAEQRPGGSLLTLATTHHGELKTLKYSDPRFENACVEFDEARLAPTFRLLWGIPGGCFIIQKELFGKTNLWRQVYTR